MERDGWTCQLCGKPTPAKLRGTTDPRAPELGHRVPCSVTHKGPHTWANVRCECRECNGLKGDRLDAELEWPVWESHRTADPQGHGTQP